MPSAYLQWQFHSGERVVAHGPLVLSATGSLELRLVSSAILEHTNNSTSHSWLALVIVNNDRRTRRRQGQVCFPMHLYEPHNICIEKLFRISDNFSSEATEPNLLRFLAHLSTKWSVNVRRAASTIVLKAYSSYARGPIDSILDSKHWGDL